MPPQFRTVSQGCWWTTNPSPGSKRSTSLICNDDLRRQLHGIGAQACAAEVQDVSQTAPVMLQALESTEPNRDRVLFTIPRTQTESRADVDIVIRIHNSSGLAKQAIEAALPELDETHRLVLINASSDGGLLDEYTGRAWVTIHRGNLAVEKLTRPEADIILMEADTRPMPGFVRRLAATAGSNPTIGTVTAVSNHGGIASVPDLQDAQELAALEHPWRSTWWPAAICSTS